MIVRGLGAHCGKRWSLFFCEIMPMLLSFEVISYSQTSDDQTQITENAIDFKIYFKRKIRHSDSFGWLNRDTSANQKPTSATYKRIEP